MALVGDADVPSHLGQPPRRVSEHRRLAHARRGDDQRAAQVLVQSDQLREFLRAAGHFPCEANAQRADFPQRENLAVSGDIGSAHAGAAAIGQREKALRQLVLPGVIAVLHQPHGDSAQLLGRDGRVQKAVAACKAELCGPVRPEPKLRQHLSRLARRVDRFLRQASQPFPLRHGSSLPAPNS